MKQTYAHKITDSLAKLNPGYREVPLLGLATAKHNLRRYV